MILDGFDIIFFSWFNFFSVILLIVFAHLVSRSMNSIWFGVPLLIWLFQALIFYLVFFGYIYGILLIIPDVANQLYTYWATLSRTLGLITIAYYLYYIFRSSWRGNGR